MNRKPARAITSKRLDFRIALNAISDSSPYLLAPPSKVKNHTPLYTPGPDSKSLPDCQATRLLALLGDPYAVAKALKISAPTVYRWTYAIADQGTGGVVPFDRMPQIKRLARRQGVIIPAELLIPGERVKKRSARAAR